MQSNGTKPTITIRYDPKTLNTSIDFDPEQVPTRWFGVLMILEAARLCAEVMGQNERAAVMQKVAMEAAQAEAIRRQIIG